LTSDGRPGGVTVTIARDLHTVPRPQLASDGTNYLVVFRYGRGRALVAMRLTSDGRPLDVEPIVIATDEFVYDDPLVTFDGNAYVITYLRGFIAGRAGQVTSVHAASERLNGGRAAAVERARLERTAAGELQRVDRVARRRPFAHRLVAGVDNARAIRARRDA
jgi:hypothetical protein